MPRRHLPLVSWLDRTGQFKVRVGRQGRVELFDDASIATWSVADSASAALAAREAEPFVIARSVTTRERALLEENGIAYADAQGHLFIRDGPVLLRVDDPTLRRAPFRSTSSVGIGYAGVRIAQELFAAPQRQWTVSAVQRAAAVSKGRASQVLQLLDREGLTAKRGTGKDMHRVVRDHAALLDWLAGQPKARTTRPRLECAIYAENDVEAARRAADRLAAEGIRFSLTGSVGARLAGARVATASGAWIRVDPDIPLAHAAAQIGAMGVQSGGNVVLVRDVGHVGIVGGDYPGGGDRLAREARIYLDLFSEPRGESAADLFRDLLLHRD